MWSRRPEHMGLRTHLQMHKQSFKYKDTRTKNYTLWI